MKRIIFHGSEYAIEKPVYHGGRRNNDYGHGFYCTFEESLAKEWAVTPEHDGYANCYEIEDSGLTVLDLNEYGILAWLTVLLENRTFHTTTPLAAEARDYLLRHFHIDFRKVDVIKGYRADDSYFSFAQDFISGGISLRQLSEAMRLGELGEQYVIRSKKAYEKLTFLSAEPVTRKEYLQRREGRDVAARRTYFDSTRRGRRRNDVFITQILNEEMTPDDVRLQ